MENLPVSEIQPKVFIYNLPLGERALLLAEIGITSYGEYELEQNEN